MPDNNISLNMKTTGAAQTQSAVNGVASSLKKLAVAYLGYRTIAGAVKFFAGTVRNFVDQKNATDQLSIAIGKNAQQYVVWADKIQNITKQTEDQILSMMRLASTLGVGEGKLQQTTKAAIGLGRALGIDAAGALRLLSKAETGSFMQLQRYLPILKTFTTTREKLAFIMSKAALGWKMEKQAAADSPWELMRKSLGKLSKTIGGELFENTKRVATALNDMLRSDNAQAFAAAIGKSVNAIAGLVGLGDLGGMIGRLRFGANAGKERKRALGAGKIAEQQKLVDDLTAKEQAGEGYGTGLRAQLDRESAKLAAWQRQMQEMGPVSKDLTEEWPAKLKTTAETLVTEMTSFIAAIKNATAPFIFIAKRMAEGAALIGAGAGKVSAEVQAGYANPDQSTGTVVGEIGRTAALREQAATDLKKTLTDVLMTAVSFYGDLLGITKEHGAQIKELQQMAAAQ